MRRQETNRTAIQSLKANKSCFLTDSNPEINQFTQLEAVSKLRSINDLLLKSQNRVQVIQLKNERLKNSLIEMQRRSRRKSFDILETHLSKIYKKQVKDLELSKLEKQKSDNLNLKVETRQKLAKVINERFSERLKIFHDVKKQRQNNEQRIQANRSEVLSQKRSQRNFIISTENEGKIKIKNKAKEKINSIKQRKRNDVEIMMSKINSSFQRLNELEICVQNKTQQFKSVKKQVGEYLTNKSLNFKTEPSQSSTQMIKEVKLKITGSFGEAFVY